MGGASQVRVLPTPSGIQIWKERERGRGRKRWRKRVGEGGREGVRERGREKELSHLTCDSMIVTVCLLLLLL